jgi:hypothetical protein
MRVFGVFEAESRLDCDIDCDGRLAADVASVGGEDDSDMSMTTGGGVVGTSSRVG